VHQKNKPRRASLIKLECDGDHLRNLGDRQFVKAPKYLRKDFSFEYNLFFNVEEWQHESQQKLKLEIKFHFYFE